MADRLTQLQDAVNSQADNFCNSIGILQQMSQPSPLSGYGSSTTKGITPDTDHTLLFAQMIARTAKDIEVLIESLPSEESTAELQAAGLQQLEQESELAGEQLKETVKQGEQLLASIQAALHDIATKQLEMERIAAEECISAHTSAATL
eukprot:GFUD01007605.1.p1 GENE.GFUD01007605.1~~GFUD01007605.1.p1  ORF type:complete len:149 (-),score=57.16 GFUD01007605.1:280-726(-)